MEVLFFFIGLVLGLLGGSLQVYVEMSEGSKKTDENLIFRLNNKNPQYTKENTYFIEPYSIEFNKELLQHFKKENMK